MRTTSLRALKWAPTWCVSPDNWDPFSQRSSETRNGKKLSRILDGATRMASMRALKWAPTWYVSTEGSTFISHPDLIQRLAIKGISGVSWDISSGGSFQSSQWACSHGTLQNPWEVFSISTVSAALCVDLTHFFPFLFFSGTLWGSVARSKMLKIAKRTRG